MPLEVARGGTMDGKILIVDDEKEIADLIEVYLINDGYIVYKFYNGSDALKFINETEVDLAILDIMLPDIDGFHICQKIREKFFYPVIMLTAKDEVMDKVAGLDSGADDYLTKPFAIEELLARMRVAFKHCNHNQNDTSNKILTVNHLCINIEKRMVTIKDTEIELTKKEFDLLLYLVQNKNIVLTRDKNYQKKDVVIVHSMEQLLEELKQYNSEDIYIIGGERVYKELLPYCSKAYVTRIDYAYQADAFFPNLDNLPEWELVEESEEQTYFDLEYVFAVYQKK